jgi:hypothetical protein
LFFLLRKVDHLELIEEATSRAGKKTATRKKTLAATEVADVFGIELAEPEAADVAPASTEQSAKPKRRQAGKSMPVTKVVAPVAKAASKKVRSPKAKEKKDGEPGA